MKRLLWPLKVNAATAGFGVSPTSIDSALRTDVQLFGLEAGLTPQETALVMLALTFGIKIGLAGLSSGDEFDAILATLRHEGKIDCKKPEIIDALDEMGYATEDMPLWGSEAALLYGGRLDGKPDYPYSKTPIAQLFGRKRWNIIKDSVDSPGRGS